MILNLSRVELTLRGANPFQNIFGGFDIGCPVVDVSFKLEEIYDSSEPGNCRSAKLYSVYFQRPFTHCCRYCLSCYLIYYGIYYGEFIQT